MGEKLISVLDKPRVFAIGLERTGTGSLARALESFDYKVTGQNGPLNRPRISKVYRNVAIQKSYKFEAFYGNPWPLVFQDMYQLWPNAKFILTIRDPQKWIASMAKAFGGTATHIRKLQYGHGNPVGREQHYIDRMIAHETAVREYFREASSSLLVMDITAGDGYKMLSDFLNQPFLEGDFPHEDT
jgi:hypothetical protein